MSKERPPVPTNVPPWFVEAGQPPAALAGRLKVDVAVVGAGITGLTAAVALAEGGVSVALLEANRVGLGVSCFTTAKLSSLQATKYTKLTRSFGVEAASTYASANQAALQWVAARTPSAPDGASFRRRDNWTYAATPDERRAVEKETEAAAAAGLPVSFREEVPLPFETYGGVRLTEQAEFDPLAFQRSLADAFAAAGGKVFENTRVLSASVIGSPIALRSDDGVVEAEQVVIATHIPFLDRSAAFARTAPQRSYIVAVESGQPLEAMFISAGDDLHSLRSAPSAGGELTLVGGEGHKVGQAGNQADRYERLRSWAGEHLGQENVVSRWSAQDYVSADDGPLIGPLTPGSKRIWMATGYSKWGLTTGAAAGLAIARAIGGESDPLIDAFTPSRVNPKAALPDLMKEGADVGLRFVGDRLRNRPSRKAADLAPGEAEIAEHEGKRVAAFRDPDGNLNVVSPVCTHLGCQVAWNDAEHSWDCPCHGSRFAPDGAVLQGPATAPLKSPQ